MKTKILELLEEELKDAEEQCSANDPDDYETTFDRGYDEGFRDCIMAIQDLIKEKL